MVFEWGLRRLFVWHFSLADLMLKEKSLEAWCADFLNAFRFVRGPVYVPGRDGEVLTRHTWRYPVGHIEEWLRWCRRYTIRCERLPEKNQIRLVFFQYRNERDLAQPVVENM
ncbi:MAG: hypothetical protein HY343_06955 [Lentisphaerae bacterium]|nr:hypothetical protein [Lentisphaerota bacterium]